MTATDSINEYFLLMESRPEYFIASDEYPIETKREILERYSADNGVVLGVVYKSPYNLLVVDLIRAENGSFFTYERIIPSSTGRGVVCVPMSGDKFVLIRQYRHAIREYQLCFPRGFGEDGLTAFENAEKEMLEETGATVKCMTKLGEVIADSGLSGSKADVILCEISQTELRDKYEGIVEIVELTLSQFTKKAACGEINDGFTLAALELYCAKMCQTR